MQYEIQTVHPEIRANLKNHDLELTRRNIYAVRRSLHDRLPINRSEVHQAINQLNLTSADGHPLTLVNDPYNEIIIFGTVDILRYICSLKKIYMDGTFRCSTKFFLQMFIIHGIKNGNYIPLLFCLLPNKEQQTYEVLFRTIIRKCMEINEVLHPSSITVDFEKAIHLAINTIWIGVDIKGCRFHLTQNWWRKIQDLGLSRQYKDHHSIAGYWLRWTFGMPWLHPDEVSNAFTEDLFENAPPAILNYLNYLCDNYIDEFSVFPPKIWASDIISSETTINACESFHSRFNSLFNSWHPNIYIFTAILKGFVEETFIKIRSTEENRRINSASLAKYAKLHLHQAKYYSEEINRQEYVERASTHFNKI